MPVNPAAATKAKKAKTKSPRPTKTRRIQPRKIRNQKNQRRRKRSRAKRSPTNPTRKSRDAVTTIACPDLQLQPLQIRPEIAPQLLVLQGNLHGRLQKSELISGVV